MPFKKKSLNKTMNKGTLALKYKDQSVDQKSRKVEYQAEDCQEHTFQGNLKKQSSLKQFQKIQITPAQKDEEDWEDYLEPQEKLDESLKDAVHYYQSLLTGKETVDESLRKKLSRQLFQKRVMDPNAIIPSCPQFSRKVISDLQSQVNDRLNQNNVFMPIIFPQKGRMSKGSMNLINQNQRMLLTEFDGQTPNVGQQRNKISALFPKPDESFDEAIGRANRKMQSRKSQHKKSKDKSSGEDSDQQNHFDDEKSQESANEDYFSQNSDQQSKQSIDTVKLDEYYCNGIKQLDAINSDTITADQLLLAPSDYCKANFISFDLKKLHHYKDMDPKYYWFSGSSFVDELYMQELATNQKYLMPVLDEIRQEQWHYEFQKTFEDPDPEVIQMLFPTKKKHLPLTEEQFIYQTNESIIMNRKRMIPDNVLKLSVDMLQQLNSNLHLLQEQFNQQQLNHSDI